MRLSVKDEVWRLSVFPKAGGMRASASEIGVGVGVGIGIEKTSF